MKINTELTLFLSDSRPYICFMKFWKPLISLVLPTICFLACQQNSEKITFHKQYYFYSNTQGNNTIEGDYIKASKIINDTLFFGPEVTGIIKNINKSWIIGQGSGKPYYDSGKEYYWHILKVLEDKNAIIIKRNPNLINLNLPFVFWKTGSYPIQFSDNLKGSWGFSKIIFDKKDSLYKTHLFECDTNEVSLYSAISKDLNKWKINPLLQPNDFNNTPWNVPDKNGIMKVTPLISDVVKHENKYYSFAYGDDEQEKTYIGLLTSTTLEGNYHIQKEPILSPNPKSLFSNHDVYFPKVVKNGKKWLMFYTSKNNQNEEFLCCASSSDLFNWETLKENIIPRNKGWNAAMFNQICAQVTLKADSIILFVTGAKDVGDYSKPNKGNVMDAAIGKFIAHKDSLNFMELPGNPVFGGNPTFEFENDHIGGAFQELNHDGYTYTFYHGKGRSSKNYTLLIR